MQKLVFDGRRVDHLPTESKDIVDTVCGVVRAIATGLAKPTDTFSYVFAGPEIFGAPTDDEIYSRLPKLPDEAIPGSSSFLDNMWGL